MNVAPEYALRSQGNRHGVMLLVYKAIMNVSVMLVLVLTLIPEMAEALGSLLISGETDAARLWAQMMQQLPRLMKICTDRYAGWGYVLAVAISFAVLLIWRKPRAVAAIFAHRDRRMGPGRFFMLLTLFMSCQTVYQLAVYTFNWLLDYLDVSLLDFLEQNAVSTDSIGMFLYVCILAPVFEELLFRGLILQSLLPFGRKFAILFSAFFFGLFHGSPLQGAFAAMTGLVMGYVAAEYSIYWSIALHMINNWLFADVLTRLTRLLPYELGELVIQGLLLVFFLAALIILLVKYRSVASWWTRDRIHSWQLRGYGLSPGMLVLSISCLVNMTLLILLLFM